MRKVASILLMVLSVLVIVGCGNSDDNQANATEKVELTDIFSSGQTFYWSKSEEDPAWYSLSIIEDSKVEITDLETNEVYSCDYKVEKVEDNIYKYYFKGGQRLDTFTNVFGKEDTWKEYNVINLNDIYVFDPVTDTKANKNADYEEVEKIYERGLTYIIFTEK